MVVCTVAALAVPLSLGAGQPPAGHDDARMFPPNRIEWKDGPPSLPPGAKVAVLEGDPAKPGPFVFRIKFPDGYRVPPHTHPKPERVTVLAGTLHLGLGDTFDPSQGRALPA